MLIRRRVRRPRLNVKPPPLTPEDVPVGLTLDEVKDLRPKKYGRLGDGSKDTYRKHWRYFRVWRKGRGIPKSSVETRHVKQYLRDKQKESLELRKRPLSPSWMGGAVASIRLSLEWEKLDRQVDWVEIADTLAQYQMQVRPVAGGG